MPSLPPIRPEDEAIAEKVRPAGAFDALSDAHDPVRAGYLLRLGDDALIHAGVLPSPAAHDFTGNGRPDLVVGNSAGELLFYENRGEEDPRCLGKDVMLTAGGEAIRIAWSAWVGGAA